MTRSGAELHRGHERYHQTLMAELSAVADVVNVQLAAELRRTSRFSGRSLFEVDHDMWLLRLRWQIDLELMKTRWKRPDEGLEVCRD